MNSSDKTSAKWRKSTYSNAQASCVEACTRPGHVLIRDTTQHGTGLVLSISPLSWRQFTASIRAGASLG
jgi:hypothetical protein